MNPETKIVIGVDESGVGSLAGSLIVCAAAFLKDDPPVAVTYKMKRGTKVSVARDSKTVAKPEEREALDQVIRRCAHAVAVIEFSSAEIDQELISRLLPKAIKLAIARCIEQIVVRGQYTRPEEFLAFIDGETEIPQGLPCQIEAIPDGDKLIWQIGAASIVAKVACDAAIMLVHAQHPQYNFAQNKGYATLEHRTLLKKYGLCSAHRKTFRPVYQTMGLVEGMEF